jgi:hypothetical protein
VMEAKGECMKATAEALCNKRVLKLQAWEKKYLAKIEELCLGIVGLDIEFSSRGRAAQGCSDPCAQGTKRRCGD